jgi:alpha-galactosidase/6-phospho-beta-glucosidase family protein
VLVGIARDMEEICPEAWMLNITNPMTTLTRSVLRETSIKAVGLCHEVGNFCLDLAIAWGLPHEQMKPTVVGVNHFPVITELDAAGIDGIDRLKSMVESLGGWEAVAPAPPGSERPEADPFTELDFARRHFLKLSLFDRWGVLPGAGDRHLAEFVPSILTEEAHWGADWGVALTTIAMREKSQREYIEHVHGMLDGSEQVPTWSSDELVAPVIDSLTTGTHRELPLNLANTGQCPDLPADAVVEAICIVDGDGMRGRDTPQVPAPVAELLRRHVATQELTVRAAVEGSRALAEAAFELDPLAGRGDLRETEAMVDELLSGTSEWLSDSLSAHVPAHA